MDKIIKSENAKYNNFRLQKIALKGLSILTLSTSVMLSGCGVNTVKDNNIAYESVKNDVTTIKIDNINLLLTKPIETDGKIMEPGGFVLGPNDICYKLMVDDGKAPEGYVLGADGKSIYPIDTENSYYAPEGYILVGDKIVEVIPIEEIDNKEDYKIYDDYGIIIKDAPLRNSLKV